jgi:hypothetical protein
MIFNFIDDGKRYRNRQDIEMLVDAFYRKVVVDETIGCSSQKCS